MESYSVSLFQTLSALENSVQQYRSSEGLDKTWFSHFIQLDPVLFNVHFVSLRNVVRNSSSRYSGNTMTPIVRDKQFLRISAYKGYFSAGHRRTDLWYIIGCNGDLPKRSISVNPIGSFGYRMAFLSVSYHPAWYNCSERLNLSPTTK